MLPEPISSDRIEPRTEVEPYRCQPCTGGLQKEKMMIYQSIEAYMSVSYCHVHVLLTVTIQRYYFVMLASTQFQRRRHKVH
jgi:hypothetical protein